MADLAKYFDFNATAPTRQSAKAAFDETAERFWHNPSSLYREAGAAKLRLEDCREELADRLGIDEPERVVFTSSATEANNALVAFMVEKSAKLLAVSSIEHPCVQAPSESYLESGKVREIPVNDRTGIVDLDLIKSWVSRGEVSVVSVMAANNETGVLQPWAEVAEMCREHGALFHTDAAQWIGKMPVSELGGCDFLTGSGHKFGGGKGSGFLVLPDNEMGESFHGLIGGPQEEGRRAGTENLPAVAAMVAALSDFSDTDLAMPERALGRDRFEQLVTGKIKCEILAQESPRLWNTSMLVLPHTKNLKWLTRLSSRGFCVSTGSACSAGRGNPSRVMAAMGLDFDAMNRVLRLSGGWGTTVDDWVALADAFFEVDSELAVQ
tara:strand:- start:169 stop:1311 length:1143 start_codon:yes stop_codon:yes gene_type:complete